MKIRTVALAVPLALGMACQHASRQGSPGTGAMSEPSSSKPQASGGGAAGGPLAEDPIMRPGPSIQGHAEDQIVVGRIAEKSDSEITIATPGGEHRTLQLVEQTAIELDGMEATGDDLTEGQPVRASFDVVDGQEVAVKVRAGDASAGMGTGSEGTGSSADQPAPAAPADPGTPPYPGAPTDQGAPPDHGTAPDAGWGPPGAGGTAPSGAPPR
jgi:hypothetical protein